MNTNKLSLLGLIIIVSFCINACKDKNELSKKNASNTTESKIEKRKNIKGVKEMSKEKSRTSVNTLLRPNEEIELEKTYRDTVTYLELNDDFDYRCFLAKKNNDTIAIIYNNDQITRLIKGDKIEINWELARLEEAGDPEITYIKPYLVSFKKISSTTLIDKKVKVLWREDQYDEELKTEINTIILDKDYLKNIHELERAALAYVATFIGNECEWDGKVNENRSNLKCKLITHLNLGYQCSTEHLGFLTKWFADNPEIVVELKKCPTIPNTATIQSTFNEIELVTNSQNQTIIINYSVSKLNTREGSVSNYIKTETFNYNLDDFASIHIIKSDSNTIPSNPKTNKNSFVISCGSGCAMTYSESKIISNNTSKEVIFKVEMYVNESLSDTYNQTYIYNCTPSIGQTQIQLKGVNDYKIEEEHPQVLEKLKLYLQQLCTN